MASEASQVLGVQLTPHKISLCLLTRFYFQLRRHMVTHAFKPEPNDVSSKSELSQLASLLVAMHGTPDTPYEPTGAEMQNILLQRVVGPHRDVILSVWRKSLLQIYSPDHLVDLFAEVQDMLRLPEDDEEEEEEGEGQDHQAASRKYFISQTSPFGIFLRTCVLLFNDLSFTQILDLFDAVMQYHGELASAAAASTAAGACGNTYDDDDEIDQELAAEAALARAHPPVKAPLLPPLEAITTAAHDAGVNSSTSSPHLLLSRRQLHAYLITQAHATARGIGSKSVTALRKALAQVSQEQPLLPVTHYLNYLLHLEQRDYPSAVEALHAYFDFMPSQQAAQGSVAARLHASQHYAALSLGVLHLHLGHPRLALAALRESLRVAQQLADQVCVAHVLFFLYKVAAQQGDVAYARRLLNSLVSIQNQGATRAARCEQLETERKTAVAGSAQAQALEEALQTLPPARPPVPDVDTLTWLALTQLIAERSGGDADASGSGGGGGGGAGLESLKFAGGYPGIGSAQGGGVVGTPASSISSSSLSSSSADVSGSSSQSASSSSSPWLAALSAASRALAILVETSTLRSNAAESAPLLPPSLAPSSSLSSLMTSPASASSIPASSTFPPLTGSSGVSTVLLARAQLWQAAGVPVLGDAYLRVHTLAYSASASHTEQALVASALADVAHAVAPLDRSRPPTTSTISTTSTTIQEKAESARRENSETRLLKAVDSALVCDATPATSSSFSDASPSSTTLAIFATQSAALDSAVRSLAATVEPSVASASHTYRAVLARVKALQAAGDLEAAASTCLDLVHIAQARGDRRAMLEVCDTLCDTLAGADHASSSLRYMPASAAASDDASGALSLVSSSGHSGTLAALSLSVISEAVAWADALGRRGALAQALTALAGAQLRLGMRDQAARVLETARSHIDQAAGPRTKARAMLLMAEVLLTVDPSDPDDDVALRLVFALKNDKQSLTTPRSKALTSTIVPPHMKRTLLRAASLLREAIRWAEAGTAPEVEAEAWYALARTAHELEDVDLRNEAAKHFIECCR